MGTGERWATYGTLDADSPFRLTNRTDAVYSIVVLQDADGSYPWAARRSWPGLCSTPSSGPGLVEAATDAAGRLLVTLMTFVEMQYRRSLR